jgi:hypothetical protein
MISLLIFLILKSHAGVSRSATIAISYIMKSLNSNSRKAHQLAKTHRPVISPNHGFMRQLSHYEDHIFSPLDQEKHISQPKLLEKIKTAFPLTASIVKKCAPSSGCTYLEGNRLGELVDDAKIVLPFVLARLISKLPGSDPWFNRVNFP